MIKNKKEYKIALKKIEKFMDSDVQPKTPNGKRFEKLITEVEGYEAIHYPIDPPNVFITKLEDTLIDSAVPKFFKHATGREYSDRETCVNDIRRMLMTYWNDRIREKLLYKAIPKEKK